VGGNPVYCVKTGTDIAEAGSVVTKTTTTRILPVSNEKPLQFWDYLADLSPQEWGQHILYMYRTEPSGPGGQGVPMGKFVDASIIPWNDQEEAELAIMQKFGGRAFRVIVKRGSQRMCEGKIYVDAQPRTIAPPPETNPQPATGFPMSEASTTAQVASQAINTIAGYERQGAQIGMEALTTAANVLARFSGPQTVPPEDELTRQMKAVMIQRMLQPPPDPIELLTKVLALQSSLAGGPAVNPLKNFAETVELLKTFGVTVGGSSAPAVSAGAELMRQLPQVASYVTQGLTAWAHGREAERDMVAMQTRNGASPAAPAAPIPARVQPVLTAPVLPPLAPAPNPQPVNGSSIVMPSLEFVESKIVEILACPISFDDAAEEVLAFLQVMDGPTGNLVPQLTAQGEAGLLALFEFRPTLKPATTNLPPLTEFIRAFLKYAGENAGEGQSATDIPRPN